LVRFRGTLHRLEKMVAPANEYDIKDYWQGWLEPEGGPVSPIVVYFLRLPDGMPHGMKISEQVDVGWQWPVNDLWGDRGLDLGPGRGQGGNRWYSMGRLNYSVNESRLVNAVLGLEYDACCWLGRVAVERVQTSSTSANTRIMFQLEFVGFTRLGVNPLQTLKNNIPGYQLLREGSSPGSRFNNYD
jgi:hypothetical protein